MTLFNNSWVKMPQHIIFFFTKIKFEAFHELFFSPKMLLPPELHIYFYIYLLIVQQIFLKWTCASDVVA